MKASELIQLLANEIEQHGDCTVVIRHELLVEDNMLQLYHHVGPVSIRSTRDEKQILLPNGALINGGWAK